MSTEKAVKILLEDGQIDGAHHKTWVIDQALRELLQEKYEATIKQYMQGEDGQNTYYWDEGIAP